MQKQKTVFVSQKGTGLTQNEKKAIIENFSSSIRLAERKFFANMVESLSLQGLPPAGDGYFGKILRCSDGRPFWDDISTKRNGGELFTHEGARNAIGNVSLNYLETTKFFKKNQAVELNLMIASHRFGKHDNAAFSIRYEFTQGKTRFAGALFVSGGTSFDAQVLGAGNEYASMNGGAVVASLVNPEASARLPGERQ